MTNKGAVTTSPAMTCINCGHHTVERYCGRCGQYQYRTRFALRPMLRQAVEDALNLDRGLFHTVVALTTNPVKYLIIWVALRRPFFRAILVTKW